MKKGWHAPDTLKNDRDECQWIGFVLIDALEALPECVELVLTRHEDSVKAMIRMSGGSTELSSHDLAAVLEFVSSLKGKLTR